MSCPRRPSPFLGIFHAGARLQFSLCLSAGSSQIGHGGVHFTLWQVVDRHHEHGFKSGRNEGNSDLSMLSFVHPAQYTASPVRATGSLCLHLVHTFELFTLAGRAPRLAFIRLGSIQAS